MNINSNEQVKKDYDEFNETKDKYHVTITRDGYKIIFVILFFLLMIMTIIYLLLISNDIHKSALNIQQNINPMIEALHQDNHNGNGDPNMDAFYMTN